MEAKEFESYIQRTASWLHWVDQQEDYLNNLLDYDRRLENCKREVANYSASICQYINYWERILETSQQCPFDTLLVFRKLEFLNGELLRMEDMMFGVVEKLIANERKIQKLLKKIKNVFWVRRDIEEEISQESWQLPDHLLDQLKNLQKWAEDLEERIEKFEEKGKKNASRKKD